MTAGQQRAVRELERIRAVSDGGFDFQFDPGQKPGWLAIVVSLRIGSIAKREGGLELRDREVFGLLVPPNFPFRRPALVVTHERFAGFPHVIWANTLCLYQSQLEWNPANGLYGFFERLNLWLGKAALNDMDPVEGPLEPPHHLTNVSQAPFVVRADAPVNAGERWVGLAVLEKRPNRTELVEWRESMEDWPADRGMALAVILPEALPMEFPKKGAELFAQLDKQGFDRAQILRYLALASLLTPAGEASYMIVGLPMRRAPDGTRRVHVAVWSIKSAAAESLRSVLGNEFDSVRLRELRQAHAEAWLETLSKSEVSWCRVMDDRPEIVMRRDAGSPCAWFLKKRVLVLGCGALGSWAAEMIVRAGTTAIDLVDNGIVKPGLLTRQNFVLDDIGSNKAKALAPRLAAIAATGVVIRAFDEEAHAFATGDVGRFAGYDVVLDCTASHITQMMLERDWVRFAGHTPPVVSMVTDAKAQHGLCIVQGRDSRCGVWDAYVRLKHRLCGDGARREIIAAFYEATATKALFQPEPGCSDPTFAGSTADVASIAAGALNLACAHGLGQGKSAAFAFGLPSSKRPTVEVAVLDEMDEYVAGDYRVRIAKKVGREARGWVRQNNRLRSPAYETGGLLWGMWDDAIGVIWVFDASGPPADSLHDPAHFICGVDGTTEEHKRRFAISRGTSGFIGFWHTHPNMESHQSGTDFRGMATLVSAVGDKQKRALMLIYGRNGTQPTAGIYVYESHALTERGDYVQVGAAQVALATSIV
jgi:integrative and conjugative element protein (TIGR02256 family)